MDDIIQELRCDFAQLAPQTLEELSVLYARMDWPDLKDAFHKLKGAAAVCRLEAIRKAAEACQVAASNSDKESLDINYNELISLMNKMAATE